jgi:hypothetical protein
VYRDAANARDLGNAIEQALQPPFRVLNRVGTVVAAGIVNGDPVRLPSGIYTVEVVSDPPWVFEGVAVQDGKVVQVTLAEPG